jgi:hypothetical protein
MIVLLALGIYLSASEYQRDIRPAYLNLRVGSSENCVYFEADHAVTEKKDIAVGFHTVMCDQYTNEKERVFEQSEGILLGAAWFNASAYENSWFVSGFSGYKKKELRTYLGSHSEVDLWRSELIGGYQYHFDFGLSLTAGLSLATETAFSDQTEIVRYERPETQEEFNRLTDERLNESRLVVLMGWRF